MPQRPPLCHLVLSITAACGRSVGDWAYSDLSVQVAGWLTTPHIRPLLYGFSLPLLEFVNLISVAANSLKWGGLCVGVINCLRGAVSGWFSLGLSSCCVCMLGFGDGGRTGRIYLRLETIVRGPLWFVLANVAGAGVRAHSTSDFLSVFRLFPARALADTGLGRTAAGNFVAGRPNAPALCPLLLPRPSSARRFQASPAAAGASRQLLGRDVSLVGIWQDRGCFALAALPVERQPMGGPT